MKTEMEKIILDPGRYILAVSGGVDSMVLLDLLASRPGIELIVTHFNHGIREDAAKDEELVRQVAKDKGLEFQAGHGNLGAGASEDQARQARYKFLEEVRRRMDARSIITAHHQDDLIETAIINILRGSGRRGLSAIKDNVAIVRPLIDMPKEDIVTYARMHNLRWLDDSTNQDPKYLRNYVRLNIMPKLRPVERSNLILNIDKVAKNRKELDNIIATLSHTIIHKDNINRSKFSVLPFGVANELMSFWLREQGYKSLDRKTIERLSMGLKTASNGSKLSVSKDLYLIIAHTNAHFSNR